MILALFGSEDRKTTSYASLDLSERKSESAEQSIDSFAERTLLARFNLQAFSQRDWDHQDLSEILVTLVEACDKRDFKPVLECALRCAQRKKLNNTAVENSIDMVRSMDTLSSMGLVDTVAYNELDVYQTVLYLAKYQCTSAFHVFFPAQTKPCKGYPASFV
jgi:hypothetical protein